MVGASGEFKQRENKEYERQGKSVLPNFASHNGVLKLSICLLYFTLSF